MEESSHSPNPGTVSGIESNTDCSSSTESLTSLDPKLPIIRVTPPSPNPNTTPIQSSTPSSQQIVKFNQASTKPKNKLKSLFNNLQLTPKNNVKRTKQNLGFALDRHKQTTRLQQRFNNHSEFSVSNFAFSPAGISATLAHIHPVTFTNFAFIINKFCGDGSNLIPRCDDHNNLSLDFEVKEKWDSSEKEALVKVTFSVHQKLGGRKDSLGAVSIHYTTCNIQVQASKSNVPVLLHHLVEPLMTITTRMNAQPQLELLSCIDCTLKALPPVPLVTSPVHTTNHPPASPQGLYSAQTQNIVSFPMQTAQSPSQIISPIVTKNVMTEEYNRLYERVGLLETNLVESNHHIHELQNLNSELKNKVDDLTKDNTLLKNQLTDQKEQAKTKCSSVNQSLSAMSKQITELGNKIDLLTSEKDSLKQQLQDHKVNTSSEVSSINQTLSAVSVRPNNTSDNTAGLDDIRNRLTVLEASMKSNSAPPNPTVSVSADRSPANNLASSSARPTITNPPPSTTASYSQAVFTQPPPFNMTQPPPRNVPPQSSSSYQQPTGNVPQNSRMQSAAPRRYEPQARSNQQPARVAQHAYVPSRSASPQVCLVGASNSGKISLALRNSVRNVNIHSTPGATFDLMIGEIKNLPPCDILVISGGVNESDTLEDMEMARFPLREAIRVATWKAGKVVVLPPPPLDNSRLKHNVKLITNIMRQEAQYARVGFVEVDWEFGNPRYHGRFLFDKKGLHVNKLGAGIYAFTLLSYLYKLQVHVVRQFCVECHHTNHTATSCNVVRSFNRLRQTYQPEVNSVSTHNRFQPLASNYQVDQPYNDLY